MAVTFLRGALNRSSGAQRHGKGQGWEVFGVWPSVPVALLRPLESRSLKDELPCYNKRRCSHGAGRVWLDFHPRSQPRSPRRKRTRPFIHDLSQLKTAEQLQEAPAGTKCRCKSLKRCRHWSSTALKPLRMRGNV